jgi:hypothetical protein
MLLRHWVLRALSRARANTGNKIAAKMAIIAITTNSSISVKPLLRIAGTSSDKSTTDFTRFLP